MSRRVQVRRMRGVRLNTPTGNESAEAGWGHLLPAHAHLDSVSPRRAKSELSGEENHCIQFGLAS